MIATDRVELTYHSGETPVPVLRGVSLQIQAGEFVSLMGSSGSGKTTLLNLIGGLEQPTAGTLRVAGQDYLDFTDAQLSRFRLSTIGFVFQFFNLLPHLLVRENIALPLLFLGSSAAAAQAAAAELAGEVGLADKLDRKIHQLSGGEMQRVALARALVHRPRLLLADEPTGNLDSKTGTMILDLLRALATRHGATVLMVTHDPAAARIADRMLHMRDGQLVDA
jgi:ABC-type lipoprotein export system ATPase subunit